MSNRGVLAGHPGDCLGMARFFPWGVCGIERRAIEDAFARQAQRRQARLVEFLIPTKGLRPPFEAVADGPLQLARLYAGAWLVGNCSEGPAHRNKTGCK